eukprot:TRINITY_DN3694_c0_g1_i1.p1 TRINITY_DN3694_c0_g1~~TRINITY_DN3694_c0_g1_i1.p1  ORF type:complete len:217 (+),score=33.32 TRINITY_DN3694_c0_g1_i1:19-669(+)
MEAQESQPTPKSVDARESSSIVVHHLQNSRSQRILWLLEELQLPYTVKRYERNPKTMLAPPELKEVHPLGKSPVISDGELVVAETGLIIEYLVDKYGNGKLVPPKENQADYLKYKYFLHYCEGSLMPLLTMRLVFDTIQKAPAPFFAKPIKTKIVMNTRNAFLDPNAKLHFDYLEAELSKRTWFAGDEFTAADIMMSYPLEAATSRREIVPLIAKL